MVTIISSELVVPSEATPRAPLWLSNLDLAARKSHSFLVYFYRPNDSTRKDFFSAESLKSSLAKALVPFYPLAGRLGVDKDGRTEIDCNREGALFVVAKSNAEVGDLESFASPEMKNLYVPPAGQPDRPGPLLMVQVTSFKCGGVALGTAMHHMLVDGRSAFQFMETWSRIACSDDSNSTVPPFFDHTLLCARPEPKVLFDHWEYKSNPKSINIPPPSDIIPTLYAISVQDISKKQIDALKHECKDINVVGGRVSTFCAVTTLVWRCFCMARELDKKSESKLYTMIDMRNRMKPALPATYIGNAVIRTSVSEMVHDIISGPMKQVANRVHEATKKGDEYARSLIDYLETSANMEDLPRSGVPVTELRVISWLGMPTLTNADLGWGKPIFCAPAYYNGYVFVMDSLSKDGGVSIVVSLEPECLVKFEKFFKEEVAALDYFD